MKRYENALPRALQVESGIERLTPETDDHGDHWHDGAQLASVAAARARLGVRPGPARRLREGELHAAIVVALERGQGAAAIVRDLRAPLGVVVRVSRLFAEGAPAGTVIPPAVAADLAAALGVPGVDPVGWAAAARALRALVRAEQQRKPAPEQQRKAAP